MLARVFTETGESHLPVVLRILHKVLAGIEEKSPSNMANRIVRWHKDISVGQSKIYRTGSGPYC